MRGRGGLAAIPPTAWTEATRPRSRGEPAPATLKSPQNTATANPAHGEIDAAALSRQAIAAQPIPICPRRRARSKKRRDNGLGAIVGS